MEWDGGNGGWSEGWRAEARMSSGSLHNFTICVLNGGVMKPFLISTALSIPLISNALSATSFIASRIAASSAVSCRETTCGVWMGVREAR